MSEDKEISNFTASILAFIVTALIFWIISIIWPDKTIPSEEQKPQVQNVKTEVLTHVIRCTAYVNDTCTEYKVYKIVKE